MSDDEAVRKFEEPRDKCFDAGQRFRGPEPIHEFSVSGAGMLVIVDGRTVSDIGG